MSHAVVADLPVPVAPSSTTSRSPAWMRRSSSSMAAGWSPAGAYWLTTSNRPPARTTSSTARYSERASTGCSVAKAMFTRVEPATDRFSSRDRMLAVSTLPSTRHSTWSPAPTPIRRASCGRSTSTTSGRGGFTWPGRPRAAPSSTTWSRGCCRRWACVPRCSTSTPAMNATRTTTSTSAGTRRGRPCGGPRTTTWTWSFAPASGVELADVDELLTAVRHGLLPPEVGEQAVQRAVDAIDGLSRHNYDLDRWLAGNGMALAWRGERVGNRPS